MEPTVAAIDTEGEPKIRIKLPDASNADSKDHQH